MKDLRNYIDSYELTESLLFESEEIINETFIRDFANWLGSKSGSKIAKIKNFWGDLKNFGKDTKAAFDGMLASLLDERNKKENKKEKQELIDKAENVDEFYKAGIEYVKKNSENDEMLKDSTFIYTTLLVKTMATEKKDEETLKFINPIFDKIPEDAKKHAAEVKKEIVDNKGKETTTEETPKEEIEKKVEKVITNNDELLGSLAKEVGIKNIDKLKEFVSDKLNLGNNGEKVNDEVILGTCIMVCGAYRTQDPDTIEKIAKRLNSTSSELLENI